MPLGGPVKRELEIATQLARDAGALLDAAAGSGELRGTPDKLEVDEAMGDVIVAGLSTAFPDDGILCEDTREQPKHRSSRSGRAWIVDPHDGTSDFHAGRRETSVSIALVDRGELVLGVVRVPCAARVTEPRLRALLGGAAFMAAWVSGGAVEVERGAPVPEGNPAGLLSQKVRGGTWDRNARALAPLEAIACASMATRLALVASGAAEVGYTLKNPLAAWDFAAGQALLQGAGGELVDPTGQPIVWHGVEPATPRAMGYIGARSLTRAQEIARRLTSEVLRRPT